jgi:hypothetical protein
MATGATEFLTVGSANTDVDNFVPEIWSKGGIIARENQLVLARLSDRQYEAELSFGDVIHVNTTGNLGSRTKTQETAITFENLNETQRDITINRWIYAAIAIESQAKAQVDRDMFKMYAPKMGYALGLDVDDILAGLIDDVGSASDAGQTVGALGVPLTDDLLMEARQHLDDADVPEENRFYYISPREERNLLGMDKFVHNDYSMLHGDVARLGPARAYVTSFVGYPVYKSNNVEGSNAAGHDNALIQQAAFQLVMQIAPRSHKQFDIDQLADKFVMEQLYGTATLRGDHAVFMRGA